MLAPLVTVSNLSFGYGQRPVLADLSLSLAAGQMTALIGPNGAGKSTLLKCISGWLQPSTGEIVLAGKNIKEYRARDRARILAWVGQDTRQAFDFNVTETVFLGREPYLQRWQRETEADLEAVQLAMDRTDTGSLADRMLSTLSGGERQRVLIARALAQEPRLLLLDEPTSELDISYQAEILGLLQRLNIKYGLTILAVIHDLNLAVQYFDQFVLLSRGKIVAAGPAASVITTDNLEAVYGSPRINISVDGHPRLGCPLVTVGSNDCL